MERPYPLPAPAVAGPTDRLGLEGSITDDHRHALSQSNPVDPWCRQVGLRVVFSLEAGTRLLGIKGQPRRDT
jgi:hypothetical protein